MDDWYDMFYKGKIWLLLGLLGSITGLGFILMEFAVDSYDDGSDDFILYLGIIIVAFSIYSFYHYITFKERIDINTYSQMVFIRKCKALCDKRSDYLKVFENDQLYIPLKELYNKLPSLYNQYGIEVLNTPLQLTKPVTPYTAAFLGTQIGGVAVGIVAAQSAIEKQKAYEKNVIDVIESSLRTGNALDKVTYCYDSIESIIGKKDDTRHNWENEKRDIDLEFRKKYKVI